MHARTRLPLAALLLALPTPAAHGQDVSWPEMRGPHADGQATRAEPPLEWSEARNVAWKTAVHGKGWSTPVVAEGRVWLTTATEDGSELYVMAFDAATGEVLHDRMVFTNQRPQPIRNKMNGYASPSPVVEPGRVYAHFGTYGTIALDTASGARVWHRRDLNCDHMEGPGSSPILFEDLLVFHVDGADVQYVVALDTATGETRWRTERSTDLEERQPDLRKAYATPLLVEVDGKPQLVSTGAEATMGYDPRTGEELWKVNHEGFSMSSRAIVGNAPDPTVFVNTGYMKTALLAIRLGGTGDVTDTHVAWKADKRIPNMSSPLFVDGRIHLVSDGGIASCLDAASGDVLWQERIGTDTCASLLRTKGRIYSFDRSGKTTVMSDGPTFELLAENQLDEGFMASAAVDGDALILRTRSHLYRIEETQ